MTNFTSWIASSRLTYPSPCAMISWFAARRRQYQYCPDLYSWNCICSPEKRHLRRTYLATTTTGLSGESRFQPQAPKTRKPDFSRSPRRNTTVNSSRRSLFQLSNDSFNCSVSSFVNRGGECWFLIRDYAQHSPFPRTARFLDSRSEVLQLPLVAVGRFVHLQPLAFDSMESSDLEPRNWNALGSTD